MVFYRDYGSDTKVHPLITPGNWVPTDANKRLKVVWPSLSPLISLPHGTLLPFLLWGWIGVARPGSEMSADTANKNIIFSSFGAFFVSFSDIFLSFIPLRKPQKILSFYDYYCVFIVFYRGFSSSYYLGKSPIKIHYVFLRRVPGRHYQLYFHYSFLRAA